MPSICFYFQVHQPLRLKKYSVFNINQDHFYEDDLANSTIMRKVANKCYLPVNRLMLDLINQHQGQFRIAYSISGTAIEQMKRYSPETLESFKDLVNTGCVEILAETYYHSLSFVYSIEEFKRQVKAHEELVHEVFGVRPTSFRNTELIYSNHVAKVAEEMGYEAIMAEGADRILDWRSADFAYTPHTCEKIKVLLRNYKLSDDIAFRFSNQAWDEHPLTVDKFCSWAHGMDGNAETINLFMDYETFGEHQWESTGILEFLKHLPSGLLRHPSFNFKTPTEVARSYAAKDILDVHEFVSWADMERDLTAWKGNSLQDDSLYTIYSLESRVYASGSDDLIRTWQALLTSDHFYYMCTKFFSDGDVHKYFNPYNSPYEAYINYQNVVSDFIGVLEKIVEKYEVLI